MNPTLKNMLFRQFTCLSLIFFSSIWSVQIAAQPNPQHEVLITDENGEPLVGALVILEGLEGGLISDEQGRVFHFPTDGISQVTIKYLGFLDLQMTYNEYLSSKAILLIADSHNLDAVILIGRANENRDQLFRELEYIDRATIETSNPQTTVEALEDYGGVYVQRSQMGGGSPIIRGFEANRVLLVVDGVRMNNAIYRNGHLQNAITVDPNMLDRMEILFGPGAITYGSDALGGVVHFRSRRPFPKETKPDLQIGAMLRYSSANTEKATHLNYQWHNSKWAFAGSATVSDFGDLRTGSRRPEAYPDFGSRPFYQDYVNGQDQVVPNIRIRLTSSGDTIRKERYNHLVRTGYSQIDFGHQATFLPSQNWTVYGNFQFSTSTIIPRFDNLLAEPGEPENFRFAEWNYGPQKRMLAALANRFDKKTFFFDHANIIASVQDLREERITRRFGKDIRETQQEKVRVAGLTADFKKSWNSSSLTYGVDFQYNLVESVAFAEDIDTGETDNSLLTRFPSGGSNTQHAGIYLAHHWKSKRKLFQTELAVRYSFYQLQSKFGSKDLIEWPNAYIDPGIQSQNGQFTWSGGLKFDHPSGWRWNATLGTAFRAPNLDDFTKIRERGGFVTIPNPDLRPEKSLNAELSFGKGTSIGESGNLDIDLVAWYTRLTDAVVRQIFPLPDGSTVLNMGGDSLTTLGNVNADQSYLYGGGFRINWQINKQFDLGSRMDYTYGRNRFQKTDDNNFEIDEWIPFAHIPPLYGNTYLRYSKNRLKMEFRFDYQSAKDPEEYAVTDISPGDNGTLVYDRSGSSDNLDYSPYTINDQGEVIYAGSYAWFTLNLYATWELNKHFTFNLGIENILDHHYRAFSSGLSAPGINFIVALRGAF